MRKRTPTIANKLTASNHLRFEQLCRIEGNTKTEVAREAILQYLHTRTQEHVDEHQSNLEKRLYKIKS